MSWVLLTTTQSRTRRLNRCQTACRLTPKKRPPNWVVLIVVAHSLHDTGNRGRGADHIMGTILLSVFNCHWHYAHVNGVRGDGINPVLGSRGTVSEDAVRLDMDRIDETAGLDWLSTQILGCI